MTPVRLTEVKYAESFEADREGLRQKYPEIDRVVGEVYESLFANVPHVHLDSTPPNVYAIRADYPPQGSLGRGRFIVTYHRGPGNEWEHRANPMQNALHVITLLTITERKEG